MNELTKNEKFDKKEISDALKILKESSTFNMSRGGRELFHTNFLAFILDGKYEDDCQSYEAQVKKLILQQLFGVENTPKNVITFRERSNLDLIVIPALDELNSEKGVKRVVVVEAKLKSIPTAEQLEKYNIKFEAGLTLEIFETLDFNTNSPNGETYKSDISRINIKLSKGKSDSYTVSLMALEGQRTKKVGKIVDVTLTKLLLAPNSIANNNLGWKLLDWFDFLKAIKTSIDPKMSSLFGQLIADYLISTEQLLILVEQVRNKTNNFIQKANGNSECFENFYDFSVIEPNFRAARLHDLVGKVAYYNLQVQLKADLTQYFSKPVNSFKFNSFTFYSRSIPGLVMEYQWVSQDKKQTVSLGVQLQGNNYRHFIYRDGLEVSGDIKSLMDCAKDSDNDWLYLHKNLVKSDPNVFDKNKFVYHFVKIESTPPKEGNTNINSNALAYDELLSMFKNSLEGVVKLINKDQFIGKLKGSNT